MYYPKRLFKCSIEMLYLACKLAWDFCGANIADFAAFRAKYTVALVAQMLADIEDAEGITDVSTRNAAGKKARIALDASIRIISDNWQELKRYIMNASQPAEQEPNIQAAGGDFYEKAARGNWEAASILMKNASAFMAANLAFLQADGNMPVTFPDLFDDNSTVCKTKAKAYFETDRRKPLTTADKVKANNAIYTATLAMLADAKRIYINDSAMLNQFSFTYLVRLAGGSRPGGIKGAITDSLSGKPVQGAVIMITNENRQVQTDKNGRYDLKRVAAGSYEISVEAPGYDPYFTDVTVKASVTARANVIITNAMSSTLATDVHADEASVPLTQINETAPDMKVA